MSRNLILSVLVSILLHGGVAFSDKFFKKKLVETPKIAERPTIVLDQLPPPEPEELEITESTGDEAPTDVADLAPPMQTDVPSAVIDSPFVQQIQAPPPPGLNRPTGIVIPTNTRPATGAGVKMANLFNLADLDNPPESRVRTKPIYPMEMRRTGLKGEVIVGFIVDVNGNVRDPYIIRSSNPGFEQAALDVVVKWRFKPGRKGGAAVNTKVSQPLVFVIPTE
jgi:periplasmic protein TonB